MSLDFICFISWYSQDNFTLTLDNSSKEMQGPDREKMLAVWEENLQKISGGTTSTDKV